jgi:hypothetical protein
MAGAAAREEPVGIAIGGRGEVEALITVLAKETGERQQDRDNALNLLALRGWPWLACGSPSRKLSLPSSSITSSRASFRMRVRGWA